MSIFLPNGTNKTFGSFLFIKNHIFVLLSRLWIYFSMIWCDRASISKSGFLFIIHLTIPPNTMFKISVNSISNYRRRNGDGAILVFYNLVGSKQGSTMFILMAKEPHTIFVFSITTLTSRKI